MSIWGNLKLKEGSRAESHTKNIAYEQAQGLSVEKEIFIELIIEKRIEMELVI